MEIEKRKGNLIFHGVKEMLITKPEDDSKDHDRLVIEEILGGGLKLDPLRHIEEIIRIGRYDEAKIKEGKVRPIRIKIKTAEGRVDILKRAKELKTSGFAKVFIAPDLTRKQQLVDKELREKLKELKAGASNDEERNMLRIKSGKVIKNSKRTQDVIVYQPKQTLKQ